MIQFLKSFFHNGLSTIQKAFCKAKIERERGPLESLYREANRIGGRVVISLKESGPPETDTEKRKILPIAGECLTPQCQQ